MAKPVITTTTSVLDYLVGSVWAYSPFATNSPTAWSLNMSPPPGMSFNSTTGVLSGSCNTAGVYVRQLIATNADGDSDPVMLAICIGTNGKLGKSANIEIEIDIITRKCKLVTLSGISDPLDRKKLLESIKKLEEALKKQNDKDNPTDSLKAETQNALAATKEQVSGQHPYEHAIKYRDDIVYMVSFWKYGYRVELPLVSLTFAAKIAPDDPVVFRSDAWRQEGFGSEASYVVRGKASGGVLRGELESAEKGTSPGLEAQQLLGSIEFEWLMSNDVGGIGPNPLRASSQSMPVMFSMDYQETQAP